MLERFFGKDSKSALPKNQIDVICPVCGAAQREPRLVVTTICRKCGEHLRIEKRGHVVASSQINPVPSSIYPAVKDLQLPPHERKKAEPPPTLSPLRSILSAALTPEKKVHPEDVPLGLGAMMGFHEGDEPRPVPLISPNVKSVGEAAEALHEKVAATSSPSRPLPAPQSTLHRMKEQSHKQHYFKEVECFECRNLFKVGRSAKSTSCPNCGSAVCLEDFDVNLPTTSPIRTRGDVVIRKNGNVQTSEIICKDLKIFGIISAAVRCSGEMMVRVTGTIIGDVRCRRLVIDKGSDVHFINTLHADEVEVRARCFANIHCSGPVRITATGWIHGDVTARAVAIEPGGQLDGAMNILRGAGASPLPLPPTASPVEPSEGMLPFLENNGS